MSRFPFFIFLCAAAAAAAASAPPAKPDSTDPDPGRVPRKICVVYDGRVKEGFNFSRARAASLKRLLASVGIEASAWPSEELSEALSDPCAVMHAVAWDEGTFSSARAGTALDGFFRRGGRCVAWGCDSPSLARRFGVRRAPGGAAAPPEGSGSAEWEGISPEPGEAVGAPEFVANAVPFVARWIPDAPGTRVAARWRSGAEDAGRAAAPGPAAALRGAAGFWLGRVLYDDGNASARARFAAALCGALDPSVWEDAARNAGAELPPGAGAAECRAAWSAAVDSVLAREVSWAKARPLDADRRGRPLGVWEKTGYGPCGGDWDAAAGILAGCGVTDLFLNAGSLAGAVAELPGVPPSADRARRGGASPFPDALRACRARGIRVHAWLPVLAFDGAPDARHAEFAGAGRLLRAAGGGGGPIDWLDPENAENAADLERAVSALAASGLDGICLDYLRYPDFETDRPHPPAALDILLGRLAAAARAAGPTGFAVRASVFGGAVNGHERIGQNWGRWLDRGLVDEAVPMNYVATSEDLGRLLEAQSAFLPRTWCGVGATSHAALLSGPDLVEQLRAAWRAGCAGCAVYPFDARFVSDLAPVLRAAGAAP